jgi:hypothetical protein
MAAAFNMSLIQQVAIAISTEGRAVHNLNHDVSVVFVGGLTFFSPNIK